MMSCVNTHAGGQSLTDDWILAANEIARREGFQWVAYDDGINALHLSRRQLDKLAQLVVDRLAQKLRTCPVYITAYEEGLAGSLKIVFPYDPDHACCFSLDRFGRERPLGAIGYNTKKR